MKEQKPIQKEAELQTIPSNELRYLLRNPTNKIINNTSDNTFLNFEHYKIKDENISIHNIDLVHPVVFKHCVFEADKIVYIKNIKSRSSITFNCCDFNKVITINESIVKGELCFLYVNADEIHISNSSFEKLSFSVYEIPKLTISYCDFGQLIIGEQLETQNIKDLTIFGKENKIGNIKASGQIFNRIYLSGSNKDKEFFFEDIKCDELTISDFKNEGVLKFHGLKPLNKQNHQGYIQFINSDLKSVEFFRTHFSSYIEVIVIDSFINECLFISCQWRDNIRALRAPGHLILEKSVLDGRLITLEERFAIKEAYRQLKISMSNQNDKIQEAKFYAQELVFHNTTLNWTKPWDNQFWDKLILLLSRWFSDFGQSFIKPVFWLFIGHFILYTAAIALNAFNPLYITLNNATWGGFNIAVEKFFIYLYPLRKIETSLSGPLIILDFAMRIWSSYMIYNIVRATRRFIT